MRNRDPEEDQRQRGCGPESGKELRTQPQVRFVAVDRPRQLVSGDNKGLPGLASFPSGRSW